MNKFLKIMKNFYVVFSVCFLSVLVISAMFIYKNVKEQRIKNMALNSPYTYVEPKEEESVSASNQKTDIKKETESIKESKNIKEEKNEFVAEENDEINVMSVIQEDFKIEKPVKNEIINKFSGNELVYSKTYEDYRTHNGVDIKCDRGEAVFAAHSGVVEEVYADALEGIVIVINHGNGYKSVYKNLSSEKMVKKGEPVSKGQTISGVGETAIFEAAEDSHIHFELINDGNFVNPEEYFE